MLNLIVAIGKNNELRQEQRLIMENTERLKVFQKDDITEKQ